MDLTIDRTVDLHGITYRVLEILNSDTLLVVKEDDYKEGVFPLQTYVIPGQ